MVFFPWGVSAQHLGVFFRSSDIVGSIAVRLSAGLYGLTPLLADTRGILTRYNWIADILNLVDAPLENIINAPFVPLPQVRRCLCNQIALDAPRLLAGNRFARAVRRLRAPCTVSTRCVILHSACMS